MTAGPCSPGRGPPVHQPVSPKSFGTSRLPSRLRPSRMTGALTPIAAISIWTGGATRRGGGTGARTATAVVLGDGAGLRSGAAGAASRPSDRRASRHATATVRPTTPRNALLPITAPDGVTPRRPAPPDAP